MAVSLVQSGPFFFSSLLVLLSRVQLITALLRSRFRPTPVVLNTAHALAHSLPLAESILAEVCTLLGLLACHYSSRSGPHFNVYLSDLAVIHTFIKLIFMAVSFAAPDRVTFSVIDIVAKRTNGVLVALVVEMLADMGHCYFLARLIDDPTIATNAVVVALLLHRFVVGRQMVNLGVMLMKQLKRPLPSETMKQTPAAPPPSSVDKSNGKLATSIKEKGDTSYYFAHKGTNPTPHIVTDGLPQPVSGAQASQARKLYAPVDSYSFVDLGTVVRVDFAAGDFGLAAVNDIPKEKLIESLEWSSSSIRLALGSREFKIPKLFAAIDKASLGVTKSGKLRIELYKATRNDQRWTALQGV